MNRLRALEPHPKRRQRRTDRMADAIVESLRWLDVQAPGRAYTRLQEALAEHNKEKASKS